MPLRKVDEKKITKNYKRIITGIDIDRIDLLDTFIQEEIFSHDDVERVKSKPTTQDKNREFIRLLVGSKPEGYQAFIDFLKSDGAYKDLAEEVDSTKIPEQEESLSIEKWIGEDRIQPEQLKAQLTDLTLLYFSKSLNPEHLGIIGTNLGFSSVDVQNIEYKYNRAPEAASHELLVRWRNRTGQNATVQTLLEILLRCHDVNDRSIHDDKVREAVGRL